MPSPRVADARALPLVVRGPRGRVRAARRYEHDGPWSADDLLLQVPPLRHRLARPVEAHPPPPSRRPWLEQPAKVQRPAPPGARAGGGEGASGGGKRAPPAARARPPRPRAP